MEDLMDNFSKHIKKLISPKLGACIRNLAKNSKNFQTDEDISKLETNIQMLIESYLTNLKDNDYKEIAKNIFNSFIEEDDKNIIKAVNFYKRTYQHYQEMNLRKKFFRWRKTSLKLKMINLLMAQKAQFGNKNKNNKNKTLNHVGCGNFQSQKEEVKNNNNSNNEDKFEIENNQNLGNLEDYIENKNNNNSNYKFNYEYFDEN
jgi:hypothetical protein